MRVSIAARVVERYRRKLADQPAGARQKARDLTSPINKTKGIDRGIQKENGKSIKGDGETTLNPHRRDIQPKDVFSPSPKDMGVRQFAEKGKDLSKALENQVPKDKGFGNVRNLSQYLLWSDGGSGEGPVGK